MIDAIVTHKAWGTGKITKYEKGIITVSFEKREARFAFPTAFPTFLVTDDAQVLSEIDRIKSQATVPTNPTKAANVIENDRTPINKKQKKTIDRSNIAFKCNLCDGGKNKSCVGFKGVCSDSMIKYNIETAHHVWCASESLCSKYLAGEISRQQLDQSGFVCYESNMLTEWKASAGVVQTGARKGTPMKLLKVQKNSLAVLTTRDPNADDKSRYVFAVFLVDESYEGDSKEEGYVTTNSKWKLELSPSEARKVLFWEYYFCPNAPTKAVFGSGLHRYLSDVQAAQILRNISLIIKDKERAAFAAEFYAHYCQAVGLDTDSIEKPSGALRRV